MSHKTSNTIQLILKILAYLSLCTAQIKDTDTNCHNSFKLFEFLNPQKEMVIISSVLCGSTKATQVTINNLRHKLKAVRKCKRKWPCRLSYHLHIYIIIIKKSLLNHWSGFQSSVWIPRKESKIKENHVMISLQKNFLPYRIETQENDNLD